MNPDDIMKQYNAPQASPSMGGGVSGAGMNPDDIIKSFKSNNPSFSSGAESTGWLSQVQAGAYRPKGMAAPVQQPQQSFLSKVEGAGKAVGDFATHLITPPALEKGLANSAFESPSQYHEDVATGKRPTSAAQGGAALEGALNVGSFALPGAEAGKLAEGATMGEKLAQAGAGAGKAIAQGAGLGYGYDVAKNFQSGKTGAEAFTPGAGTAIGAAIPGAMGAADAAGIFAKEGAPKVINSLIKPLLKDFSYGKNPGRAVAEEGIVANSYEDLAAKIGQRRNEVGQQIGTINSGFDAAGGASLNLKDTLSPIDSAMEDAAKHNNDGLLKRLASAKKSLTENLGVGFDDAGNHTIVSNGERKLEGATFGEAFTMKKDIGNMTQWTGNPSDDKAVNAALKQVYGNVRAKIEDGATQFAPEKVAELKQLNEKYADLSSAEIATKYRDKITERQNLVSMPIKVGTAAGLITAVASGGAAIPALLAASGAGILEKALETPAFKTRLAAYLAKESPHVLEQLYQKNPEIRGVLMSVVSGSGKPTAKLKPAGAKARTKPE